jgi:hypothetical protein
LRSLPGEHLLNIRWCHLQIVLRRREEYLDPRVMDVIFGREKVHQVVIFLDMSALP